MKKEEKLELFIKSNILMTTKINISSIVKELLKNGVFDDIEINTGELNFKDDVKLTLKFSEDEDKMFFTIVGIYWVNGNDYTVQWRGTF
jgi:hypothetical protein